jgi:hypothetical protein
MRNRKMANRTCLVGLITLCIWTGRENLASAEDKKLEPVKSWPGLLSEKKLTEMVPAKGYLTSEAAWKKLWVAWRPDEKLPVIDFTKHLVLVHLGGMYPVAHEVYLTAEGDLKVKVSPRVPPKPGYGYGISVIERSGVKSIMGKEIDADRSGAVEQPKLIAEGDWSKPVADNRGYAVRGRLVLCEKIVSADRREAAVYVELQDACDFIGGGMQIFCDLGKTDFRPEYKGGLLCEMRDKDKRIVSPQGYPFGGAVPLSEWVKIPTDATIRLRATPFGIHRAKALAISPELNKLWVIADGDANEYFLSGTFTVDPAADRTPPGKEHVWRGTIVLPAVRIVNQRK